MRPDGGDGLGVRDVGVSKAPTQGGLFAADLQRKSDRGQGDGGKPAHRAQHNGRSRQRRENSRIDRVANAAIGTGGDQSLSVGGGNSCRPILSQNLPCPYREAEAGKLQGKAEKIQTESVGPNTEAKKAERQVISRQQDCDRQHETQVHQARTRSLAPDAGAPSAIGAMAGGDQPVKQPQHPERGRNLEDHAPSPTGEDARPPSKRKASASGGLGILRTRLTSWRSRPWRTCGGSARRGPRYPPVSACR